MSLLFLERTPLNHKEEDIMAIYHESTHGLTTKRVDRTVINQMTDPYFKQIAANNERGKSDSSFDAHAANVPLYRRVLTICEDTYKRAFEFIAGPIKHAANVNNDETLLHDYEKSHAGFYAPA